MTWNRIVNSRSDYAGIPGFASDFLFAGDFSKTNPGPDSGGSVPRPFAPNPFLLEHGAIAPHNQVGKYSLHPLEAGHNLES